MATNTVVPINFLLHYNGFKYNKDGIICILKQHVMNSALVNALKHAGAPVQSKKQHTITSYVTS